MPNFLLGMEFNLETMLLAAAISFVVAAILIWLMIVPANRSRLNKLRTTLEKDILNSEQQRMQLGTELNNLQQKIQTAESKVTEQSAQIATLEKYKEAAQAEVERSAALELSLTQKNQEAAQLTQRLQEMDQKLASLQQSWENSSAEKDAVIQGLTAGLEEQKLQAAQSEQTLQQLQAELAQSQQANLELQQQLENASQQLQVAIANAQQDKLEQQQQAESNLQQLQTELAQVEQSKLELQQQMEGMSLQVERLEERLAERLSRLGVVQSPEILEQQKTIARLEENNQLLEKKLLESEAAVSELVGKNAKKPAVVEAELTQKINALNTALAEQSNYIFRLEYDLEVKKALLNDKNLVMETIPAAILLKQEQAEARIIELEQRLNPKRTDAKRTVETPKPKVAAAKPKPAESLTPVKQPLDEIADKAKHLPDQFKGIYQKILSKKSEETSPLKAEESASKNKVSLDGVMGFFKKLDSQVGTEKQANLEENTAKNTDSKGGGLIGFFKKLDKQADSVASPKSESET